MKEDALKSGKFADIRWQAEEIMQKRSEDLREVSTKDILSLVHELQVHQIELEMQNDELRRAQDELEASRSKYSDLYDFAPISYFTFDKNGLIMEVNLTGAKKLGIERSFLINKPFSLYVDTNYKDAFYLHLKLVFRTKKQQTCEIICVDKNGNHFDVVFDTLLVQEGKGAPRQCRTAMRDITERKQVEKILKASEEKYSTLVENGYDGIVIVQDGLFKFVNSKIIEITGFMKEEIIGTPFLKLIPSEDKKIVRERYKNRLKRENLHNHYENNILTKDGRKIPVEINISQIEYENRPAFMEIVRDVSEHKKLEELHLENERLISVNKAKSEFLSIMSHELRTPLTSIIGYSGLMREKKRELSAKNKSYLDNILNSSQHLLDLIENILDLAKMEAGKMELIIKNIHVNETIDEVIRLMETKTELHKVILRTEIDPDLDYIQADEQKFKQILFNLISNAVKYGKKEGIITISTKKETYTARFSIADNGIGIKKEDLDRIFEKFEQIDNRTSRQYEGAGLGLAITKQLIEMHGGKIMVESEYGRGTTFTFFLPLIANKVSKPS